MSSSWPTCSKTFERPCKKTHGFEPLHFITLLSLAWAMALIYTDADLDLICWKQIWEVVLPPFPRNMRRSTISLWRDITTPRRVVISPTSTPTVCMPPPSAILFRSAIFDFSMKSRSRNSLSIASRQMVPSDTLLNVIWRIQITFTMHKTTIRWLRSISQSLRYVEWLRRESPRPGPTVGTE